MATCWTSAIVQKERETTLKGERVQNSNHMTGAREGLTLLAKDAKRPSTLAAAGQLASCAPNPHLPEFPSDLL